MNSKAVKNRLSNEEMDAFLESACIPLRIACNDHSGFPLIVSVWFYYLEGKFWCASHSSAHLVKSLRSYPKVGFEVATNDPPYLGVRGYGLATVDSLKGEEVLCALLKRYGIREESALARWLKSRSDSEVAVCISPKRITSWDYRKRMSGSYAAQGSDRC
ncbi:MAG: pyridoxamine 5'-phosphate oxidase family protein [Pseudomonadales bacterium]|nr:pyridoxamine 5'-phosphate oxidase family protein [Pseudomonadales bacterium]